jgi:hypothetical protein
MHKPMAAGIYMYVEDCDVTYKRAIEAGATSVSEPEDQFYVDRSAGVNDQFGNKRWIATQKKKLPANGTNYYLLKYDIPPLYSHEILQSSGASKPWCRSKNKRLRRV